MSGDSTRTGNSSKTSSSSKSSVSSKTSGSGKKDDSPTQLEVWTGYTHYLLAADGLLRVTDAVCKKMLAEPASRKVSGVIAAAHAALQGVHKQLMDGIEDMKNGKSPEYKFQPSPIPDWPTEESDTSVFAGVWQAMKGVLEQMLDAASPSSAMGMAVAGLIHSGDEIIESLEKAFTAEEPSDSPSDERADSES